MRLACVVLLAGLLVGCSSSDDDYCSTLKESKAAFTKLAGAAGSNDPDYLGEALTLFQRMREESPDGLRDEWDTVVFAWSDLVDALHDAGIEAKDFDPAKRPEGVAEEQFAHVKDVAVKLSSRQVLDAVDGINEHAKDACDVDVSL